jgi:methyl-accepting chemotaxis protein
MKLGIKLLFAPLLIAAITGGISVGITWLATSRAEIEHDAMTLDHMQDKTMSQVQQQVGQLHASTFRMLALRASQDAQAVKAFRADLAQRLAAVRQLVQSSADDPDAHAAVKEAAAAVGPVVARYAELADKALELSNGSPASGVAAMKPAEAAFAELTQAVSAVVASIETTSAERADASRAEGLHTAVLLLGLGMLVTAAAVAASWLMQRRMVAELQRAVDLACEVAQGNLQVRLNTQRNDEIGDLTRALGRMAGSLSESMSTVRQASGSIAVASVQIASGNQDLSGRTEQTASNLQQTASSMEELTGTVNQTAESARTANQLASSASEVAQRGGAVVSQVVATMDDISAASRRIADIIGTIDGIAFQTNILALNAAVEAARAGEQGRGFAVVAGEVRSLAQRSAAAAREIKTLIGASVEKVESGSRLVADAGSTMNEIVASVQRVSDIIGEISHAAAEQSAGIGQVNGAVSQLDQMTQQNAALVEQSTAAAESLKDQAQKLSEVVGRFSLAT